MSVWIKKVNQHSYSYAVQVKVTIQSYRSCMQYRSIVNLFLCLSQYWEPLKPGAIEWLRFLEWRQIDSCFMGTYNSVSVLLRHSILQEKDFYHPTRCSQVQVEEWQIFPLYQFPLCQFPLVNVDKVGIDKVGIDKVGIDLVGINLSYSWWG